VSTIFAAFFAIAAFLSFRESVAEVLPARPLYDASVMRLKRIALAVAGLVALLAYLWVAAVRAVPGVKSRKAAARARRRA
jgi:hypothetical protein